MDSTISSHEHTKYCPTGLCLNLVAVEYYVFPSNTQGAVFYRVWSLHEIKEAHRTSEHKSALLARVAHPENAGALGTIQKIDELMAMQGRRLVMEFHRADINHSGGVSGKFLRSTPSEGGGGGGIQVDSIVRCFVGFRALPWDGAVLLLHQPFEGFHRNKGVAVTRMKAGQTFPV